MPKIADFGSWQSPITAVSVANGGPRYDFTHCHKGSIYWVESRPWENGRNVVVEKRANGTKQDIIPKPYSARSRVHEYGGKPYLPLDDRLIFINDNDQLLYQVALGHQGPNVLPIPVQTPSHTQYRFADFCVGQRSDHLIVVCEIHTSNTECENLIVDICLTTGKLTPLCQGDDFYAYPRISPDGQQLCWLSWNHPHMPWDETQLWIADLVNNNSNTQLSNKKPLIANSNEALFQPQWTASGELLVVSDRSNWWNLYQTNGQSQPKPLCPLEADCATPLWSLGMSCYAIEDGDTVLFTYTRNGCWYLGKIVSGVFEAITLPFTDIYSLSINFKHPANQLVFVAASSNQPYGVYSVDYDSGKSPVLLNNPYTPPPDPSFISYPQSILFPTGSNDQCQGFYYPPSNHQFCGPDNQLSPVIVICHGGPTGATSSAYNAKIQFWTSRGFAVADINYRGSTGFGRVYREKLTEQWGQADVEDTVNLVKFLAEESLIDASKTIIRGSSAGGYTVLAALCFSDCFKAGASLYGIGDLEILARDTHKFESRYLDKLIAPYPQQKEKYHQLSPSYHAENLNCPVIFFQGLQDKVVPPEQAETMVRVLRQQGQLTRYITFPDEGHGFRKAGNIETCLNEELDFYAEVFGFTINQDNDAP